MEGAKRLARRERGDLEMAWLIFRSLFRHEPTSGLVVTRKVVEEKNKQSEKRQRRSWDEGYNDLNAFYEENGRSNPGLRGLFGGMCDEATET